MKKNVLLNILCGAGILFTVSCKKNFLDIAPTDRLSEGALLADSSMFEDFVLNRYLGARLQDKEGDGSNPGFGRGFEYAMWGSLTDESIYTSDDNTWVIQQGLLAPENTGIAGTLWGRSYRSIRECNYALNSLDTVIMSDAHKVLLRAELKFIRAFRYHDLIRNYGGVVLMGDKVYNLTDNLQDPALFTKSTLQQCMDYVLPELDSAAKYLPADNTSTWKAGRATKGAALALKSRLALYAASPLYNVGTWAAAAAAAQAVIGLNKYSLYTGSNYGNLFLDAANSESIFARLYTKNANHTCLEIANGPNGYNAWGGNTPLQNLVDDYEMANGKAITETGSGYDAANPYANRDKRFYATILYNGASYRGSTIETFIPGGKDGRDGKDNWNTSKTGYYLRKFMNDAYPIDNPWGNAGFQPWYYFRYAEILLNYAEAANEAYGPDVIPAGATMSALAALNLVRTRTGVDMPALAGISKDSMRTAVRYERRVELAFEEHRFYDVRRWQIAGTTENVPAYGITITKTNNTFTYTRKVALDSRKFENKHYWLPIPRAEIQASNNKLIQTTGY